MRDAASDLARRCGLPTLAGSVAADLLGGVLGRRNLSVPTGRPGWTQKVQVAVDGLSINSCRGFVLVRDRVGFRIFTRLCN
jgi:hypothetical protein